MLGEQERVVELFAQAESLAEELGDKWRLAHVFADSCAYFSQEGDHQRAINAGERALVLATEMGDSALQVNAQVRLVRVYIRLGDYRRAIDLCEQNLSSLKGRPVGERSPFGMQAIVSVATRSQRAVCLGEVGELAQGIGWAQEAVHIAETVGGHSHSLTVACSALSYLHLVKGDLQKALTLLDRSLQICRIAGRVAFLAPSTIRLRLCSFTPQFGSPAAFGGGSKAAKLGCRHWILPLLAE